MAAALALARRSLGCAWPNPSVGCVLVKEGVVVGRGWTQPGGRPHAETEALARAGAAARGATAYVSLEPCAHWGVTPPCTGALLAAGIARAVIAVEDPDPRVSGRGIGQLRDAGVRVDVGLFAAEAVDLNQGFFLRIGAGRPLVTLKTATTLDGRIATAAGASRWITGPSARAAGHRLRALHDAVAVGSGTARADDPALTCRLPGLADRKSIRVVLDSILGLNPGSQLVRTAREHPTWAITVAGAAPARRAALEQAGVNVIEAGPAGGRVDLRAALQALGARGLTRVLVEGGGRLASALLAADLVDRLAWFRAPLVIGGDGTPAAAAFGVAALAEAPRFQRVETRTLGPDVLELYRRGP
ncbi:MAG: bifunctional diaminohydroxyphosphoribosylaminopyrimidine deaminase/5-amino-6-(5-phosphoribosylamino)uracil reductase RibD [Alphaproteobacteria bacterium]|nr:bifunctional diaminohydroxyphosphoribosylaminopyrimidine deaminase/5-amino-6-(5-phosphoribosylamino)uracil reductase RibD [Alphaproteobacteria bacterium]